MHHLRCSNGAAFNFKTQRCDLEINVFSEQNCDEDNVWKRCNVSADRLTELEKMCKNRKPTTEFPESTGTTQPRIAPAAAQAGISPGSVAGAVIACSVFTAIICVAIVLYRRRQKTKLTKARTRTPSNEAEHDQDGNEDDTYEEITEHNVLNYPSNTSKVSGSTESNVSLPLRIKKDDNSGKRVENCYTTLLRRSSSGYEIPISAATKKEQKIQ